MQPAQTSQPDFDQRLVGAEDLSKIDSSFDLAKFARENSLEAQIVYFSIAVPKVRYEMRTPDYAKYGLKLPPGGAVPRPAIVPFTPEENARRIEVEKEAGNYTRHVLAASASSDIAQRRWIYEPPESGVIFAKVTPADLRALTRHEYILKVFPNQMETQLHSHAENPLEQSDFKR